MRFIGRQLRVLFVELLFAILGFFLGGITPLVIYMILEFLNPEMRQGGGTVFAILMPITAIGGAFAGLVYAYRLFHPPGEVLKKGTSSRLELFLQNHGHLPLGEQRTFLLEEVSQWVRDYRKMMRLYLFVLIVLIIVVWPLFALLITYPYTASVVSSIRDLRRGLSRIRERWGDRALDDIGRLPILLRPDAFNGFRWG